MFSDPGPIPELQWRNKTTLKVDETYQRTMESARSKKLVEKIAINFQWKKFGVLVITDTGFIIDGQHRHGGAMLRVDIEHVPCLAHNIDIKEAAGVFVGMNKDRVNMSPLQVFKSELVSGDLEAIRVQRAMDEAGVELIYKVVKRLDLKYNQTHSISTIRRQVLGHYDRAVRSMQLCLEAGVHLTVYALKASFAGLMSCSDEGLVLRTLRVNGERASDTQMWKNAMAAVAENIAVTMEEQRPPNNYSIRDNAIITALEEAGHTIIISDDETTSRDARMITLDGKKISYADAMIRTNLIRRKQFLPPI